MYHSMLLSQKYVRALWTPGVITNLFSSYVQSTPFRMHLQATFALRRILEKYHLNREAFEWVLGEVEAKFNQSVVNPEKMCGTLACSIHRRTCHTDDFKHIPLRWSIQKWQCIWIGTFSATGADQMWCTTPVELFNFCLVSLPFAFCSHSSVSDCLLNLGLIIVL